MWLRIFNLQKSKRAHIEKDAILGKRGTFIFGQNGGKIGCSRLFPKIVQSEFFKTNFK